MDLKTVLGIGHGKMGKVLSEVCEKKGIGFHFIDPRARTESSRSEEECFAELKLKEQNVVGICFADFSDTIISTLRKAAMAGLPLVIGTTGFGEKETSEFKKISEMVPIVKSTNFSRGMNIWWRNVVEIARKFYPYCDLEIVDIHHNQKLDHPSGSAMTLKDILQKELSIPENKIHFGREYGKDNFARSQGHIWFHAIRGGDVVGEHIAYVLLPGERIEIIHRATGKHVFAEGALAAAEWVLPRLCGLYTMANVISG